MGTAAATQRVGFVGERGGALEDRKEELDRRGGAGQGAKRRSGRGGARGQCRCNIVDISVRNVLLYHISSGGYLFSACPRWIRHDGWNARVPDI